MMFEPSPSGSIRFLKPTDLGRQNHLCEQVPDIENWMVHPTPGKSPVSMNMENNHIEPSSISFVNPPDRGRRYHLSEQIPGSGNCKMHPNPDRNSVSMNIENSQIDILSSFTDGGGRSHFSAISHATTSPTLNYVYVRRKPQKQYVIASTGQTSVSKESVGFSSNFSSETKCPFAREENTIPECQLDVGVSNSVLLAVDSPAVFSSRALQVPGPDGVSKRSIRVPRINEVRSSSKSNLDVGVNLENINVGKTGDLSLDLLGVGNQSEALSEIDFCLSFLRSRGLLGNRHIRTSGIGESTIRTSCSKACKTCGRSENTANLLICDGCGNAFHAWCCRPRVIDIPIEEWLCNSCEKKKQKLWKEMKLSKFQNITEGEASNNIIDASDVVLSFLDIMLLNVEPHKTEVRVGKGFQANVPEWSEPNPSDSELVGEALEINQLEFERLHNSRLHSSSRGSPIGNWLQCREVIRGVRPDIDGTVCGKWRRAPLFEVQGDDWDCFSAVLWDPAHADCAAPQELETEEVMKQLKYIQMLKSKQTGKRQKLSYTHTSSKGLRGRSKDAGN